jgi:N6-L-threonylcarbamoyladenine synthase
MLCLGIESTAHTFAASVIKYPFVKSSSNNIIPWHQRKSYAKILSDSRGVYLPPKGSGIHPRNASRHHAEISSDILKQCLRESGVRIWDLDIIAYSAGPGLGPCLRVGAVISRMLASYYKKPLVPVNHALGHVELGTMLTRAHDPLVLLVSGGHSMILSFSERRWRVFGETLDITVGNLLDQFGRAIGLSSPCGDQIERLASRSSGTYIRLPYVVKGNDVSFSGLLSAAKRLAERRMRVGKNIHEVCYSLQETAFAMLTETIERAISFTGKKEVLVVGGVAANERLREMLENACVRHSSKLLILPNKFAGDNGCQIAWVGIIDFLFRKKEIEIEKSFVHQSWRIDAIDISWRGS